MPPHHRLTPASPTSPPAVDKEAWLDEQYELPPWSRTLSGWRHRFVLPFPLCLPDGGPTLQIGQRPVASAAHADEAGGCADGLATGSTVWDAGVVLAAYVYRTYGRMGGGRRLCLDLGAGTGVVGLAAAASGAFGHVVLTDMPSVLPLTRSNVEANAEAVRPARVSVAQLRWDSAADLTAGAAYGPFDLLVGGDLLYRPQVVAPLLHALRVLVQAQTVVILAASIQHSPETLRLFVDEASAHFKVELLPFEVQPQECASREVRLLRLSLDVNKTRQRRARAAVRDV
ncbi:hypothetical protein AB1Y20_002969 [Prymnesium parvum]|uniref:Calmodulin-lysine N-methyltransferase n=1 Tax=Prymnesium parvum TaxID=97485 RepID=A0AB34JC31_PRYPA